MASKRKFVKIKFISKGEESCLFCDKPNEGHLEARFERGESSDVKGVKLSVCDMCGDKIGSKITTYI